MVAVAVGLVGHIVQEGVLGIGPPEPGAVVLIIIQRLVGQLVAVEGLHREVVLQEIVHLRGIFHEEAVADRSVTHAVAHHQVVGAVDGDEAVGRIPDRSPNHAAAPVGGAHHVIVDRIASQHPFLAQMGEFRIADAAFGTVVIHGMPAHPVRFFRFHDDVAGDQRHLAGVTPALPHRMIMFERLI